MKVASLVTGILSLVFCWVPVLGVVLGIVAVCTARGKANESGEAGLGAAGMTCGVIGLCLGVVMLLISGCTVCAFTA